MSTSGTDAVDRDELVLDPAVRSSDVLARSAALWPDRVALIDGDTRLTFAELWERVRAAAAGFRAMGISADDHVGFFLAENWRHVVSIYGVLHLGATAVPLNLVWEQRELEHGLAATEVTVLIAGRSHRDRDLWSRLEAIGIEAPGPQQTERYPRLRYVVPDWAGEEPSLAERIDGAPGDAEEERGDGLAFLMFTSGSTSLPKAAAIRHSAALRVAAAVSDRLDLSPEDKVLNTSPLYHCAGLVCVLLTSHLSGTSIALFEGYQQEPMLEHLWREQANVLVGFDVVTMRLVRGCQERHGEVPVNKMLSGPGRPVFDECAELGIDLAIMYGLTEASNIVSLTAADDTREGRRDSNGRPLAGVDVRICDPEDGTEVPRGEYGEIAFRGWDLLAGYYLNRELTLDLDADGFFHTGDYGYMDEDDRVYYRGRYARMVKTGGENVSEVEVESFLASDFPWLSEVAVIGLPDEQWGERVVAVVDVPDSHRDQVDELRERCRGRIAGFKIPKEFVSLPIGEWPVTPTGKVDKKALAELVGKRSA